MDIDIEFWGMVLVLVTGIGTLIDKVFFESKRKESLKAFREEVVAQRNKISSEEKAE